jgi:hypothetical protein
MSAAREGTEWLADRTWQQLLNLETVHREIQHSHERVTRTLDEAAMSSDRRDLMIAWNQYRSVVADLSRVTEEMGSLRLVGT